MTVMVVLFILFILREGGIKASNVKGFKLFYSSYDISESIIIQKKKSLRFVRIFSLMNKSIREQRFFQSLLRHDRFEYDLYKNHKQVQVVP